MVRKRTVTISQEYAESIINTVREPLIVLDQDLRVVSVSRSFCEFFKVKPEDTVGQLIYDLGNKQWDIPKLRELLETILPQKTTFNDYKVEHDFATIGRRTMLLNARQIERVLGKERIIFLAIEDITERQKLDDELRKNLQLLRDTGKMAKVGGWELDLSTKEVSLTEEAGRIHGVETGYKPTLEEAIKFYAPESIPALKATLKKTIETGEPYDREFLFIPSGSKDKIWVRSLGKAVYSGGKIVKLTGTFQNIDEYKRAEDELKKSHQALRNLTGYLHERLEKERKRIAGELHDELGQILTALKIDCSWLIKNPSSKDQRRQKTLKDMTSLLNGGIASVRRIATDLRPPLLDDLGLAPAIRWIIKGFEKRTGIKAKLVVQPTGMKLDSKVATAFFRVTQESLTNIARYAGATKIHVIVKKEPTMTMVRIRDNGRGITEEQAESSQSFGILSMKERIHSCGGTIKIIGRKGVGTTVESFVPLGKRNCLPGHKRSPNIKKLP